MKSVKLNKTVLNDQPLSKRKAMGVKGGSLAHENLHAESKTFGALSGAAQDVLKALGNALTTAAGK